MILFGIITVIIGVIEYAAAASCTGLVNSNLAVTGAYVLGNDSIYQIKSNEYATFICGGNADEDVAVSSELRVRCTGSNDLVIKSPPGVEAVEARWQTNDGCRFNSVCTITCSARTACDSSEQQPHTLVKVHNIKVQVINCSDSLRVVSHSQCTNSSYFIYQFIRQVPLGTGRITGDSSCPVVSQGNNDDLSMNLTVTQPRKSCECRTWMQYQERDSVGYLCERAVFKKEFTLLNPTNCGGVGAGIIIVIILCLALAVFVIIFLSLRIKSYVKAKSKPSKKQVSRMTRLDKGKLSELIDVANNPVVVDTNLRITSQVESPIYDEIPDPIALEQDNMSGTE